MRSSERISGKIVNTSDLRSSGYMRKTGDHHVTAESRQLPERVRGVQCSVMAKLRKVKELGFNVDKNFHNDILQIQYNEMIDTSLLWYYCIMNNLPGTRNDL
jgi:hypothetical protein